jgi:hypothetical protein
MLTQLLLGRLGHLQGGKVEIGGHLVWLDQIACFTVSDILIDKVLTVRAALSARRVSRYSLRPVNDTVRWCGLNSNQVLQEDPEVAAQGCRLGGLNRIKLIRLVLWKLEIILWRQFTRFWLFESEKEQKCYYFKHKRRNRALFCNILEI